MWPYSTIGDVVAWDRKAILGPDGTVEGFRDEITPVPSAHPARGTMTAIRSVTTKSGALKIDMHAKKNAMAGLAKILGMTVDATPVQQSLTVNTINVRDVQALEVARRVAFLLSSVETAAAPVAIDARAEKPAPKE